MKKKITFAVSIVIVLLAVALTIGACSTEATIPTNPPGTTATQETQPKPTVTEPLFTDTSWLPVWGEVPSYEEYFSEKHAYPYGDFLNLLSHSWGIREDGTLAADDSEADRQYRLTQGTDGLYVQISKNGTYVTVWYVPESAALADCGTFFTDGSYAYCVQDNRTLLRVDLHLGTVETLFSRKRIFTQDCNWGQLYDGKVLFFLAQSGGKGALYRLYLPSLTLELISDQLPLESLICSFNYWPDETDASIIHWDTINPAALQRLWEKCKEPYTYYESEYGLDLDKDFFSLPELEAMGPYVLEELRRLEENEDIPGKIRCSCDLNSGAYTEKTYFLDEYH